MWVLVGVGLVMRLALAVGIPMGVSPDQVVAFGWMGMGEIHLRILGWIVAGLIIAMTAWLGERKQATWTAVILTASPWLTSASLFHIWEAITLLGMMVVFWGGKKWLRWAGVVIVVASIIANRQSWQRVMRANLGTDIGWSSLGEQVNEAQRINYLGAGKTYMLPGMARKIVYNKPVLAVQRIWVRAISLIDFEQWSAPLAAWALTGMSGLPPKGVAALMYFWEIPLLIMGVLKINREWWNKYKWWVIVGLMPAIFLEKKFLEVSGMMLLPIAAILIGRGIARVKWKWGRVVILVMYIIGSGYMFKHMFFEQLSWRYSDAYLYREISVWLLKNKMNFDKIIVTNKFGPMEMMLKYYGQLPDEKIEVREFDVLRETPEIKNTVYIGLPKEVGGGAQILTKITADDELVYGFGKGIWIGKKLQQ